MISESSLHYCDVNLVSMEHEYNGPKSTLVRIIDVVYPDDEPRTQRNHRSMSRNSDKLSKY